MTLNRSSRVVEIEQHIEGLRFFRFSRFVVEDPNTHSGRLFTGSKELKHFKTIYVFIG